MKYLLLLISLITLGETTFLVSKKSYRLKNGRRKIYVDTSALIDGRILNIARSGFIDGEFIVLKSVLQELQLLADGKDSEKRLRARAGIEAVSELERIVNIESEIIDDGNKRVKVDDQLLKFAKANKGVLLTLDYNLIKIAEAEKIEVLNINDLALAVRKELLPGEKIQLKITEKGANRGQGVGHLPNGTMVVVDKAANKIGQEITVEFVRFHETSSGKMVFAKVAKG